MMFSYAEKVILKYLWIKYKYGATRIVSVNKLLKKIDQTGDVARKEDPVRPKSVCTDENNELLEESILSPENQSKIYSTLAEIARDTYYR